MGTLYILIENHLQGTFLVKKDKMPNSVCNRPTLAQNREELKIYICFCLKMLSVGSDGKESACNEETRVRSLGREDPLEKGMATHSSILVWSIPWSEKPGRL